jgi:hypothetical protein
MGSGKYAVSYRAPDTGTYTIDVGIRNADGTVSPIQHSPFTSTASAGSVYPGNCEVTVADAVTAVGSTTTVTVVPRDIYGNLIEPSDVVTEFTVAGQGVKLDNSTSSLILQVSSVRSGPTVFQVYHKDLTGVIRAAGKAVTVTFLPGQVSLSKSSIISGSQSVTRCIAGEETALLVDPRDEYGNPTSLSIADIAVTLQRCVGSLESCEVKGALLRGSVQLTGGELTLSYTAPDTGYYQLRVTQDDEDVAMPGFVSPSIVSSDVATAASACVATGDGIERAASGAPVTFVVQANGIFDNSVHKRSSDGDVFAVQIIDGAELLTSQSKYVGSGLYEVTYTAVSAHHSEEEWTVSMSVSVGGADISGSPFQLTMVAGAHSESGLVAGGAGARVATAGSEATFHVRTSDLHGNIIHECTTHAVSATLSMGGMETVPEFTLCQQGVYSFQYTVAYAGTYRLTLELDGMKAVSPSSAVTVQSAVVDRRNTFVAADIAGLSRMVAANVAGDAPELFIHAHDEFNNPLTRPICADGSSSCIEVQFRWCHAEPSTEMLSQSNLATCAEMQPTVTDVRVTYVGVGLYSVATKLTRSGTYSVRSFYRDADGTVLSLTGSELTLSVSPPRRSYTISTSECTGQDCACQPGYERESSANVMDGEVSCVLCPTGTYRAGFSNTEQCNACPATTSTVAGIADSMDACQCEVGFYDFRSTYIQCVDDDWAPVLQPELSGGAQCVPCPSCAQCLADGTILLREGYWAFPPAERHYPHTYPNNEDAKDPLMAITAYRCESAGGTCTGGGVSGSNSGCLEGSEGPTCASCKVGFTRTDRGCESCASVYADSAVNMDTQDIILVAALVAFASFLGFVMIKQAKAEDVLKLKILIGFGQVIQSFSSTYNVHWPANLRTFINMFTVFSFDLFSMGNTECSMPWSRSFYGRFIATVLTPIALVALVWVLWKVQMAKSHRRRQRAGATSPLEHKIGDIEISGQWASRAFFILVLTYLQVSSTIMDVFKCRHFEPAVDGSARVVLEADVSIQCQGSVYLTLKMAAVIGVFLYPIGVPVFFVLLLWRERKHIHDSVNQKKYGFLFGDYMAVYFLWEVWDLGRKLMLSGLLMFFKRGSVSQLLVAMVIALFALELQLRLMPYKSFMATIIQLAAFNAILLNLVGAMLLKVDDSASVDGLGATFADGFLVLVNLTVPVLVLVTLLYSMSHDLYLYSVGRFVKSETMQRSRQTLMDAISRQRKPFEAGLNASDHFVLPSTSSKWEEALPADLSDEAMLVSQLEGESERMAAQLARAKMALEQKREWLRFVRNHTSTDAEFLEMCQAESPQSYRRLLGHDTGPMTAGVATAQVPNPLATPRVSDVERPKT